MDSPVASPLSSSSDAFTTIPGRVADLRARNEKLRAEAEYIAGIRSRNQVLR